MRDIRDVFSRTALFSTVTGQLNYLMSFGYDRIKRSVARYADLPRRR